MNKKINLDVYFKVLVLNKEKKGKKETIYTRLCGETENGYTQDMRTYFEKKIRNDLMKDGYHVLALMPCSKEEASTKVEDSKAPMGYLEVYFLVEGECSGEKRATVAAYNVDFNKYFDGGFWDLLAEETKQAYEKLWNLENITIKPATKEMFDAVSANSEDVVHNF